jgi:hypothetical protein
MMAAGNKKDGSLQWLRWALVLPYVWLLLFLAYCPENPVSPDPVVALRLCAFAGPRRDG